MGDHPDTVHPASMPLVVVPVVLLVPVTHRPLYPYNPHYNLVPKGEFAALCLGGVATAFLLSIMLIISDTIIMKS